MAHEDFTKAHNYIPFSFDSPTEEGMQLMFDGPIPSIGDKIELVCYDAKRGPDGWNVSCKWKVRK